MPLNGHRSEQLDARPTDAEIDVQVKRLCAHPFLQGDKRGDLLRYLVTVQRQGRYDPPFETNKPRPTGKAILFEFYITWGKKNGEKLPKHEDDTEEQGKRLIKELATALEKYYEASDDAVLISIPRGRGTGYAPEINYRPRESGGSAANEKSGEAQILDTERASSAIVECQFLGSDREAMRYVLDRYATTSTPRLVGLRDTHVRAELPMRYREAYYAELQTAFRDFLRRGDLGPTVCTLIFGWEVDKQYVRMVQSAGDGQGERLKCYRLRNPGPLMNFILMDYDDLTTEVLFGWGQGKPGHPGAVFRSKDRRLVEEFNDFYETLLRSADTVPVTSLLEAPSSANRLP